MTSGVRNSDDCPLPRTLLMGRRKRSMAKPPATSATVYGTLKRFATRAMSDAAISSHSRNSMIGAGDIVESSTRNPRSIFATRQSPA